MRVLLQLTESVNPSLIAYGFGTIFGILAILYFARDILLSLSLTVKSIIMFSVSLSLISLAVTTSNIAIAIALFTIGGSGHAISSFYFLKWYNRERMGRFILFALSSVLFIFIGWLIGSGVVDELSLHIGGVFTIFLTVLSVIVSLVDWNEGDTLNYEITVSKTVQNDGVIGRLKIKNDSRFFRKRFDLPNIKGRFDIDGLKDSLPIKVKLLELRGKQRTISSGDEIEMKIILNKDHLEGRLKKDNIDPLDKYNISVQDRESYQFKIEDDENVNIKIE